jgi:hypothetical protein
MADVSNDREQSLIDPIYLEYTKNVIRTLGDTEFYQFFMNWIATSNNEFRFSNRRVEKMDVPEALKAKITAAGAEVEIK